MKRLWLLSALVILLQTGPMIFPNSAHSNAYTRAWEVDDNEHDRARRAVSRGEALPMSELLDRVKIQVPGDVVEVEFERESGLWIYEFKIIDKKGRLLEVYVDAKKGEIIKVEDD